MTTLINNINIIDKPTNINLASQNASLISQNLFNKIIQEIKQNNNQIPFSRFMEIALYDKEYGYYNNPLPKFGEKGDFITSPTLSASFGRCLAYQLKEILPFLNSKNILEIGAGNGDLMLDIIDVLIENNILDKYYIYDTSNYLISQQKNKLLAKYPKLNDKVIWLTELPKQFEGIIIANEVLDAIPCELIRWENGKIFSRNVSLDQEIKMLKFLNIEIENNNPIKQIAKLLPAINYEFPYDSEININSVSFLEELANILTKGAILLIDYGYNEKEYYAPSRLHGTIRGFYQHQLVEDVLLNPGLIDITSSVNFSNIAASAINMGLDLNGYTTQANFLINCDFLEEMSKLKDSMDEVSYLKECNKVNTLMSPNHMGEAFKVIGFSKNLEFDDWCGFKFNDKTYTL